MSSGEQQIAALARALITDPELLILDEPSEGLAPIIINNICDVLLELKKDGLSISMVEQNISFALRLCDEVCILSGGKIVFSGSSKELATNLETQSKNLGVSA
ncbi:MAG: ATP-binding cassette domain-containing protein [Rhizobiaceae bacterium]|nr:ATP-binding cassette domain-containing protein [Rhizobiaceae bacterium]